MPHDGGHLLLEEPEAEELKRTDPVAAPYIRQLIGSAELIQGTKRYCLWLVDAQPDVYIKSKAIMERCEAVIRVRKVSPDPSAVKAVATPGLFKARRQPNSTYLAVPRVSSETRKYVPLAFFNSEIIATDAVLTIDKADMYCFGLLSSKTFNIWLAAVSGRLESRFRISAEITYNNFPWPTNPTNKEAITKGAQAVLDARNKHPKATLATLYDPIAMPKDLVEAHRTLDGLVLAAYGLKKDATENEILAELFKRYQQLTKDEQLNFEQKPKGNNKK